MLPAPCPPQLSQLCVHASTSLSHIERALAIAQDHWATAMKALSEKMDGLAKLLRDYGLDSLVEVWATGRLGGTPPV